MRQIFINIMILLLAMLVCGLISLYFGKDLSWDLANYHYYNPYALLQHRWGWDFWPASFLQQYLSPTMDLLTYFSITHLSSVLTTFLLGAIHGINFWLLYQVVFYFISHKNQRDSLGSSHGRSSDSVLCCNLIAVTIALLGMYGPTVLPGIGSFQNDNVVSIFVLGFILLFLYRRLFSGSFLLGVAIGLKLTALIYGIGAILATAILPLPWLQKGKWILIVGLMMLLGWLCTSGYWMLTLWQQYHNPVFPFLNAVFHSTDFSLVNWRDYRFLPQGIWQTLFYPFYFSWDGRVADVPFRDFRFLMVYVLFVVVLLTVFLRSFRDLIASRTSSRDLIAGSNQPLWIPRLRAGRRWEVLFPRQHFYISLLSLILSSRLREERAGRGGCYWLFAFFIFSYIIWQYYFSIMRYLVVLEMLSPLVIYLLVTKLFTNAKTQWIVITILFYTLAYTMTPTSMIRARWYEGNYFNVVMPKALQKVDKAMVLTAYPAYSQYRDPRPQMYLIPFFPKQWQFIGIPFLKNNLMVSNKDREKIINRIQSYKGKFYLLTAESYRDAFIKVSQQFGLKLVKPCEDIKSDRQRISNERVVLCSMQGSS